MVKFVESNIRFQYLRKLSWFCVIMAILITLFLCVGMALSEKCLSFHVEKVIYLLPALLVVIIVLSNYKYLNEKKRSIQETICGGKRVYNEHLLALNEAIECYNDIRNGVISRENDEGLTVEQIAIIQLAKNEKDWLSNKIKLCESERDLTKRIITRLDSLYDSL